MKKLIILLFIPIVFACSSDSSDEVNKIKTSLERDGYKGNIKSITLINYDFVEMYGDYVVDTSKHNYVSTSKYNEFGNELERVGEYTWTEFKFLYHYNNDNLLKEYEFYLIDKSDENEVDGLDTVVKIKYDESGNIIEQSNEYPKQGTKSLEKYSYNKEGKLIEIREFEIINVLGEEQLGEVKSLRKHSYKENKIIKEYYRPLGEFKSADVEFYKDDMMYESHRYMDEKDNLVGKSFYIDGLESKFESYTDGKLDRTTKYDFSEFDLFGNHTVEIASRKSSDEQSFYPYSSTQLTYEYY
jgi:hypothetical protein